jgi:hypothetical protein
MPGITQNISCINMSVSHGLIQTVCYFLRYLHNICRVQQHGGLDAELRFTFIVLCREPKALGTGSVPSSSYVDMMMQLGSKETALTQTEHLLLLT